MMQQIELEQAVGDVQAISAAAEEAEGKTVYIALISVVVTSFLGLIGWIIKNSMARQRVHDAASGVTVETLATQRARIVELEGQIRDLLNESLDKSRAQIAANSAAQRAADKAEHASALAEEAQRNAVSARQDAEIARALLGEWMAYSRRLRALMIEAGLVPPPEPEPE